MQKHRLFGFFTLLLTMLATAWGGEKPVIGVTVTMSERNGYESVSLSASVIDAVAGAGGLPVLLPPMESEADIATYVGMVDGFVFTGGADINPARYGREQHETTRLLHPRRENFDLALMRGALDSGKPVLGICLGMQEMNVACGGTLLQDIPSETDSTLIHRGEGSGHDVEIAEGSRLAEMLGGTRFAVNSSHHQAVEDPGEGVKIVAHAPDGVVEGIEVVDHPFAVGVQWHPEGLTDQEAHANLFARLVEAAGESPAPSATEPALEAAGAAQ